MLEFSVFKASRLQLEMEPTGAVRHNVDQFEDLGRLDLVLAAK